LAVERDHPKLVVVVDDVVEVVADVVVVAPKTSTNVGGRCAGKTTGLLPMLTVAFDGEPMVMRELPIILSDST
jgi:hypothetical protein